MEDELRDPKNFLEYLFPRPIRQWLLWGTAASSLVATLFTLARFVQEPAAVQTDPPQVFQDLALNAAGAVVFAALAVVDRRAGETRVEERRNLRKAQIRVGDREVFINEQGEKMSRLKDVDDEWIIRRLERWGKNDNMPFMGPAKGALLQQIVRKQQPRLSLEVGTMAGYSALLMAQVLPRGSKLITVEKDLVWVLVAKRFLWQASQGQKKHLVQGSETVQDKVDVRWGDALNVLPRLPSENLAGKVELLLLDGVPKDYLAYLKASEPLLAPGALVLADNAGVFKDGGLKPYLEYVRSSPQYQSSFLESTLEWRDDVPDGIEVSVFNGPVAPPS